MKIITNWVINALIIFIAAYLLKGVHVDNLWTALLVAVVMGLLNVFVKPILVILTLPITVVTLGLFLLVINAILILIASNIVPGFEVSGFWWALLFSVLVSGLRLLFNKVK
jgi:putative membrane protein